MGVSGGKITDLCYATAPVQADVTEIVQMSMSGRVPKGGAATHILCVGEDQSLLGTRRSILEREGYAVLVSSARELPALDTLAHVALAIICHSVEGFSRRELISSLQTVFPRSRILLLDGTSNLYETQVGLPRSSTRPQDFVNSVAHLIARIQLEDRTWRKLS
jgi:hypothetical protein